MMVYILLGTYMGLEYHEHLLGVYSSEEGANKARETLEGENLKKPDNQYDGFVIEPKMLDVNIRKI